MSPANPKVANPISPEQSSAQDPDEAPPRNVAAPNEESKTKSEPVVQLATPEETAAVLENRPDLAFPETTLVGSLGELARLLAHGTETPPEFYFASALTVVGAIASDRLTLDINMDVDPRLYTGLIGETYSAKKSTAQRRAIDFFERLPALPMQNGLESVGATLLDSAGIVVRYGVGSAEGLARQLRKRNRVLLAYDELKALFDKARAQSSVLLPMVTSLFENTDWDNTTKNSDFQIRNARLSILGCCTLDTYASMWTSEALAIGFTNRLFLVSADRKAKVAWPEPVDDQEARLEKVHKQIHEQLSRLPLGGPPFRFGITLEARQRWEQWYGRLPDSPHAKRLDTIGLRLLALLALTTDKTTVDAEVVEAVLEILNYELQLRRLIDPIDAENSIARVEQKIIRVLRDRGALTKRDLGKKVHSEREGAWVFTRALTSLYNSERIGMQPGSKFYLIGGEE